MTKDQIEGDASPNRNADLIAHAPSDLSRSTAALEVALGAFKKQASLCRICEVSGPQHCRSEGCELARVAVAEIERLLA